MLFVKNLRFTQPPWRVQDPRRGHIVDQQDRLIATVPKAGAVPFHERTANLALIECAPELLAALLEAAYQLDMQGTPLNDSFYQLIDRARGPEFAPLRPRTQRNTQGPAVSDSNND